MLTSFNSKNLLDFTNNAFIAKQQKLQFPLFRKNIVVSLRLIYFTMKKNRKHVEAECFNIYFSFNCTLKM